MFATKKLRRMLTVENFQACAYWIATSFPTIHNSENEKTQLAPAFLGIAIKI
jgi:hypothetical protein